MPLVLRCRHNPTHTLEIFLIVAILSGTVTNSGYIYREASDSLSSAGLVLSAIVGWPALSSHSTQSAPNSSTGACAMSQRCI